MVHTVYVRTPNNAYCDPFCTLCVIGPLTSQINLRHSQKVDKDQQQERFNLSIKLTDSLFYDASRWKNLELICSINFNSNCDCSHFSFKATWWQNLEVICSTNFHMETLEKRISKHHLYMGIKTYSLTPIISPGVKLR